MAGRLVATDGVLEYPTGYSRISWMVWAKNVSETSAAVLLLNAGDHTRSVSVTLDGLVPPAARGRALKARDLWARKPLGEVASGSTWTAANLAPHASQMVLFEATGGFGVDEALTAAGVNTNLLAPSLFGDIAEDFSHFGDWSPLLPGVPLHKGPNTFGQLLPVPPLPSMKAKTKTTLDAGAGEGRGTAEAHSARLVDRIAHG